MSFLLAVVLLVGPAAPQGEGPRPLLSLVWYDFASAVSFSFEPAWREVASILAAAGVDVGSTVADGPVDSRARLLIVVLGSEARAPGLAGRHVMGSAPTGAESASGVWVHAPVIAWALGLGQHPSIWSRWDRDDFARALGRVVAHEVVHALVPELPHARKGLMAPRLGRSVLARSEARLDAETAAALRAGLERRAALTAGDRAALGNQGLPSTPALEPGSEQGGK